MNNNTIDIKRNRILTRFKFISFCYRQTILIIPILMKDEV